MHNMKKDLWIILLLILFSFPASKDLFIPGAYTSHDLTHHIVRQISMDKILSEGQFPPRWSGDLNNGYGYPVFLFNYPLPAMLGEVFHKLGLGFVDSVKAVLFTSIILSVIGMYLFLKSLLGDKLSAFLGSIFYLYAPIRFLNIYVSAAVGASLALGILPFVFLSIIEMKKGKKWAPFLGSLSLALLILSHNVTAFIFMPVILIFAWPFKKQMIAMFLLGLGLSAWFWMPAIFEKQYIQFDQIYSGFYKNQLISFAQLLRSPWGYGLSHPQNPEIGDMSYQLGLIHIAVMMVYGLWYIVYGRKIREVRIIGGTVLVLFILSVFLMLKISLPFWDSMPFLSIVQFPLRFSVIAIFCASIASGLLVKYLPFKKILAVGLLLLVIYANRNHWHINEVFNLGEDYYLNLKTTTTTYNEDLPKWGKIMDKPSVGKFEMLGEVGGIRQVMDKLVQVIAEVEASKSGEMRFNQVYFPGWDIKVDGKLIEFDYLAFGLPTFYLPSGKHLVEARFKNTPDRNIADLASTVSVIIWGILACKLLLRI